MRSLTLCSFCLIVMLSRASFALPPYRTLRGVSPYQAVHQVYESPTSSVPDPRTNPSFYAHRHEEAYISQGLFDNKLPSWAEKVIDVFTKLLLTIEAELNFFFRYSSPYTYFADRRLYQSDSHALISNIVAEVDANVTLAALPNLPKDSGFDYNSEKVRGVNIGNWLLFELWMDSELSDKLNSQAINAPYANAIVDEWTAGLYSNKEYAEGVLRDHFDTWFTEQDMIDIKNAGLNHVRIPFPYWGFREAVGPKAPYLTVNRFDKLVEACTWAKSHGIKVWVDIHGVPGSQNGFDNSGRSGPIHWPNNADYYKRTQYTFNRLAAYFSQPEWQGTVTGVEAVNEPLATNNAQVKSLLNSYYPWARNAAARPPNSTDYSSLLMVMHDGFLGPAYWEGFFSQRASHRVLLDTHPYYVYTQAEKNMKDSERLAEVCAKESVFKRSQTFYPTIAGEWSLSGPNGDRASDRDLHHAPFDFPDGPNYPYSKRYMAFMARNFAVQTATYELGAGWIHWSWKNRNAPDWSYKTGLKFGWIPKDAAAPSPFGDDPCADYR